MLVKTKIVCTIGRIEESRLKQHVRQFIEAGMDVARINMAHYNLRNRNDKKYLKKLIRTIRNTATRLGKRVAILGDIQGPKVRIKEFFGNVRRRDNKIQLQANENFILCLESEISKFRSKPRASIIYEGKFNFFENIRDTVRKDGEGGYKPVEFWFGDGRVILESSREDIKDNWAKCKVKVPGELKKNEGISVKNAIIKPQRYNLTDYPKDMEDIMFLIENDIDLLALSFVNSPEDVRALQDYIKMKIWEKKWKRVEERFCGMECFPVIAKIETEEGFRKLDEILEVAYGIMVARGDLALRTGIQTIGIYQKEIIEKCLVAGKPVITATQMLLSMMEFIEPKRSEATDVTNAIFDGTDALMLSEETADPDSKYPIESIQMMAQIAEATEKRIEEMNKLEYKYKVDQQHEKALVNLKMRRSMLNEELNNGMITQDIYNDIEQELLKAENREHICYNASKTAFELGCKAIIVLTDTGGTARMVSRFRGDIPILAGVYEERIARILKLSRGVEAFVITHREENYPFGEFQQVIEKAIEKGLLKNGDRVILVAGYPRGEPGTTTFLNIYKV